LGCEFPLKDVVCREYASRGGPAIEPPEAIWAAAMGRKTVEALKEKGLLRRIFKKTIAEGDLKKAEAIIKKGAKDAVDSVIALSNWSTSHTLFRKLLTGQCGTRYASMPLFDESMLSGPMEVDYKRMRKISRSLADALKKAAYIDLKTPNGTSLRFERGNRAVMQDTGDLGRPGTFGNLPAGEVYLAPIEGTAKGRLVLEWAATRKLKSPVTLTVEGGLVVGVNGREPFVRELRDRLCQAPENANIAELGIGINEKAKRPDNILESEKILGTAHVALGANITFGGKVKAPYHQDFVFFKPTVTLYSKTGQKKILLKNGRLKV
jgi:leucyl aminopeptidase (aminopeptidase T)